MADSVFKEFTNLYEMSKTLRFELKPIGKTKELLDENNCFFPDFEDKLFPKDKRIEEIYQNIIKPCLNELHSQFIEESLNGVLLGTLTEKVFEEYKMDKSGDSYKKYKTQLRKEIVSLMKISKFQDATWFEALKEKWVIDIIVKINGHKIYEKLEDKGRYEYADLLGKTYEELIKTYFTKFFSYLANFTTNRSNLYKDDGKFSRVATRVIDENLSRFFQNKIAYHDKIEKELLLENKQKELFEVVSFNNYINQKGIEIYNKKIWEINSLINQYNQKNSLSWNNKLPKLQVLYKQILAKVEKWALNDFVDSIIESAQDLKDILDSFMQLSNKKNELVKQEIFNNLLKFDLSGVYLKKSNLKILSNKYLSNYFTLGNLLPKVDDEWKTEKKSEEDIVSLQEIKDAFDGTELWQELFKREYFQEWKTYFELFVSSLQTDVEFLLWQIQKSKEFYEKYLLHWDFELNVNNFIKDIKKDGLMLNRKNLIKDYLDSILNFDRLVNLFSLVKWQWENKLEIEVKNKDTDFYVKKDEYYQDYSPFKIYNSVRNFLTKKHYSINKIKLNFDNPTLLDGWDKNKESDNYWVLLMKDWNYFLTLMKKWNNRFFDEIKNPWLYKINWNFFEKINYKLLPWPNKMLPKVFFADKNIDYYNPWSEILSIKEKNTFKQWYNFSVTDLHKWIDFMKKSINKHQDRLKFGFKFKDTWEYDKINEFYYDIESQWYKIDKIKIDANALDDAVKKWDLYLFQIYNKDFAMHAKWNEKIHTMYWKALFEDQNIKNNAIFKLNWQAEIFFRPKSIEEKINKNDLENKIEHLKVKNESAIEKKRYTENKILFHCPITINFVNKKDFKVNDKVREYAKNNKMNVIWIDRWEKHLLYYSLIDQDWKIKEIDTMNTLISMLIDWTEKKVLYAEKLIKKEWNRDEERKNWDEIETIKELKEWYISQVVHKIVEMAIENNAIIVMEDLNSWFKRWRQKIERQIYQKFELALVKKLNYVFSKTKNKNELGWLYKAYQLTPKIDNFQDIYAQTGIVFYTQAGYTSTTCPVCGFRKNVYKKYNNIKDTKKFIESMQIEYIHWYYSFSYSIDSKQDKKWNDLERLDWKLITKSQIRYYSSKNQEWKWWSVEALDITAKFDELISNCSIDKNNVVKWFLNLWDKDAKPFKDFMFYWNLLLQIRNSKEWDDWGYIQCPVCWFHSDNWFQWQHFNGDANWAYNIARKGIKILEKISKDEKILWISNVERDNFTQK